MFLINYIKVKRDKETDKDKFLEQFAAEIVFLFLMAGFALFSGWIVKMFI